MAQFCVECPAAWICGIGGQDPVQVSVRRREHRGALDDERQDGGAAIEQQRREQAPPSR